MIYGEKGGGMLIERPDRDITMVPDSSLSPVVVRFRPRVRFFPCFRLQEQFASLPGYQERWRFFVKIRDDSGSSGTVGIYALSKGGNNGVLS